MTNATPLPDDATPERVDGRAARWEEHRRQRRVELVDQAVRAIRRHGAGVGLDEVAAQAGTSKTVLYRHFADRAGLYRAVLERVEGQIVGRVRASLTGTTSARDGLRSVIDAYLSLVEADPELFRFVVRRPLVEDEDDPLLGISTQVADTLTGVLTYDAPTLDRAVARTWAVGLVGAVQACAVEWLATESSRREARGELVDRLTGLAWHGMSQTYRR